MKIPVTAIYPNPEQPRKIFDQAELESLAYSLATDGLLNPISVEGPIEGEYILIDGERRWRAAKLAGMTEIEAHVRPPMNGNGQQERLFLALVGNLQRSDMGPVDEAKAFQRLQEMYGFTGREIAKRVGRSESNVTARLRLLQLTPALQELCNRGKISLDERIMGTLRMMTITQQDDLAEILAGRSYTANQIMGLCHRLTKHKPETRVQRPPESDCPPVTMYPLDTQYLGLQTYFESTCADCNMFDGAGARTVCPTCPLVTFAKQLKG